MGELVNWTRMKSSLNYRGNRPLMDAIPFEIL